MDFRWLSPQSAWDYSLVGMTKLLSLSNPLHQEVGDITEGNNQMRSMVKKAIKYFQIMEEKLAIMTMIRTFLQTTLTNKWEIMNQCKRQKN